MKQTSLPFLAVVCSVALTNNRAAARTFFETNPTTKVRLFAKRNTIINQFYYNEAAVQPKPTTPLANDDDDDFSRTVWNTIRGGATSTTTMTDSFLYAMDLLGTAVFAFSGALTAGNKGMDLLGMAIIAAVTSCGGGTLRDMALNGGVVFWMKEPLYLVICMGVTLATFFVWPTLEQTLGWKGSEVPVCTADAVGLAAFAVLGAQKAQRHELHPIMWVVSGLMSACFGGVMRDVLCLQRPRILYPERTMYGTAPVIGSTVYAMLAQRAEWEMHTHRIASVAFAVTFLVRILAFNNPRRVPHWKQNENLLQKVMRN
ncbi:UPF0126 inner membrane protein YadS [Seminavis robusta]|uniref:UPF0126 inner membrane protein YadS n=1 Tax=Seminavis robusta TaxID=568900 RepID=A0A9N8DVG6_9STRA|nr:UPF0126 inner membrane protein YadS [Seminavis robusta]|eukprot:Sro391_g133160.1 UPF0126 inner membrane protein YadS (315) ;mRNA; r:54611-55555